MDPRTLESDDLTSQGFDLPGAISDMADGAFLDGPIN
jgi:hypothetical protein